MTMLHVPMQHLFGVDKTRQGNNVKVLGVADQHCKRKRRERREKQKNTVTSLVQTEFHLNRIHSFIDLLSLHAN